MFIAKPTRVLYNEPTVWLFFFVGGALVLGVNDPTVVLHCICQGLNQCMRSIWAYSVINLAMLQMLKSTCIKDSVSRDGDEPRSVLNVPRRLTRLLVRVIPGLISPTDWICSMRERERLRERERDREGEREKEMPLIQPSALSLSPFVLCELVFTVTWSDGVGLSEPLKTGTDTNQDVKKENFKPCMASSGCRRHPSHCLRVQMLTFATQTVEQWQVGYLNFGAFLDAIKNHLETFKQVQGSLRNVPSVQMGGSFPEKVRNSHSLHVFLYGSVGHISILCLLVWRHLERWKIEVVPELFFMDSQHHNC